jgi:hypothetical protein
MDKHKDNDLRRQEHLDHWKMEKKADDKWLSKDDYQKKTGQPGKKG